VSQPANPRLLFKAAALVAFCLATAAAASRLRADDEKKPSDGAKPSQLAKDLAGTWVLAGTPDKPEDPPEKGGRLKFFTGKHWCITQADPESGKVIFHHGGTYTLDGDKMAETIEYANDNTSSLIGKTHHFTIKVQGDTYTQLGQDNEFNEIWKRAK
jgi:hypothetical protein